MTDRQEDDILIGTVLGPWWKNFINIIYPLSCLICKVSLNPLSDKPLCEACWGKIELISSAAICKDYQTSSYFFQKAHAVCIYEGIIKECIHLFKYRNKLSLADPLSKLMIDCARNFLDMEKVDLVLPVPLHSTKLRQRQFNQANLLAEALAKAFSRKLENRVLIKIKERPAQVNLSRSQRLKNVRGCFKIKDAHLLKNKNILLVDDVLTTGATAGECAKVLSQAGANRIDVFTLARSVQENCLPASPARLSAKPRAGRQ